MSSYRTQKHITDPFLDKLDPKSLADFLASLATINLSAGEVVFRENDPPDVHYHIKDGTIVLTEGDETINTLGSGDGFGGTALISDLPRSVTAAARTDATLYKIPRDRFAEVIATQPGVATQIYDLLAQQVRRAMFTTVLRRIIGDFDAELLAAIEPYVSWRLFEPGETIFAQDTIGEEIYVIAAGRVRVTYDNGVRDRVLGEVGGSDFFGEMAILGDSVRTATVTALRETTTASITAEGFQKLMAESPAFASQVMQTIVQRLRGTMNRAHVHKPLSLNLSMVAASPGVDLEGFVADLMPFLQKHGSAIAVTRESFSKRYGLDHNLDQIPDILIRLWMNELEYMHNYVIYIADDDWSMWTNLITRGTDRVLFVGEAQGGPQPDDLARTISAEVPNQHFELILLHAPETRKPEGTAAWLDAYPVVRHHHVRKQDGAHFARVARLLTGNGIGLVMGGGGARGYAHIGVWRALMEAQVPVDAIGCVSMGAVVGGGFLDAMNNDGSLYAIAQEKAARYGARKVLLDPTVPVSAMMRSKKVTEAMRGVAGSMNIEDGWLPFFCISTNMSQADLVIHRRGPLHKAVRASLSIPGVFSPVVRDGDLIIDGGVMNNFPVDIMREFLGGGTVIGALVRSQGSGRTYAIDDHIDGIRVVLSRFVPWMKKQRVPSIVRTILSSSSVNSYHRLDEYRSRTDVLLETDTTPYGTLDFDNHAELAELGYTQQREAIRAWAEANRELIDQPPQWHPI